MQPHGCTLAVVVMWKQKHNKCIDLNTECSLLTPSPHKNIHNPMCVCVCAVKKNLKQRRKTENERERARARERKSSEARVYCQVHQHQGKVNRLGRCLTARLQRRYS